MAEEDSKFNHMQELGSTGLTRFGGLVYEEWLAELQGVKGIRVYREMRDNDPVVGAILRTPNSMRPAIT